VRHRAQAAKGGAAGGSWRASCSLGATSGRTSCRVTCCWTCSLGCRSTSCPPWRGPAPRGARSRRRPSRPGCAGGSTPRSRASCRPRGACSSWKTPPWSTMMIIRRRKAPPSLRLSSGWLVRTAALTGPTQPAARWWSAAPSRRDGTCSPPGSLMPRWSAALPGGLGLLLLLRRWPSGARQRPGGQRCAGCGGAGPSARWSVGSPAAWSGTAPRARRSSPRAPTRWWRWTQCTRTS